MNTQRIFSGIKATPLTLIRDDYFQKGEKYLRQGDLVLAEKYLQRAEIYFRKGTESGSEEARFNLSQLLYEQVRLTEAKTTLLPLLNSHRFSFEASLNMGYVLLRMGNFKEALHYFQCAETVLEGTVRANYSSGLAFYYDGEYERAMDFFERALKSNPDYFPVKNAVAACKAKIKMQEKFEASERGKNIKKEDGGLEMQNWLFDPGTNYTQYSTTTR